MKEYKYIYAYQIENYPNWEIVEVIKNDNKISESGLIIKKEDKSVQDKEIQRLNNIIDEIYNIFKNGYFEDGCDCIKIYDMLEELKEGKE